uniref:Uncharacterized protein n=1 Tax=Arundo donax TaxID=35708 RepID=A0A0A9AWN9_ARUDO
MGVREDDVFFLQLNFFKIALTSIPPFGL